MMMDVSLQPPVMAAHDGTHVAAWGWSERFRMPLYKPGTRVRRMGQWETISHVALRRDDMVIYLTGQADPVDPLELELEPTVFTTFRVPDVLYPAGSLVSNRR